MKTKLASKPKKSGKLSKQNAIDRIRGFEPCLSGQIYMEESKHLTFAGMFQNATQNHQEWLVGMLVYHGLLALPVERDTSCRCSWCCANALLLAHDGEYPIALIEAALRKALPCPAT